MKKEKLKCYICKKNCNEEEMSYSKCYCKSCYNDYKRAWRSCNKERVQGYNRAYYNKHREELKAYLKAYRERYNGYYIYMFTDELGLPLYIGATTNYRTRINNHLSFNSHIAEKLKNNEWDIIEFADITDKVYNIEELHFIENYLIELYEPCYNSSLNIIRAVEDNRAVELLEIAQNLKFNFYKENLNIKKMLY